MLGSEPGDDLPAHRVADGNYLLIQASGEFPNEVPNRKPGRCVLDSLTVTREIGRDQLGSQVRSDLVP